MKNEIQYWEDGINFYFLAKIKIPFFLKVVLITGNIILLCLLIFLVTNAKVAGPDGLRNILGIMGFIVIWFFTFGKYSLWNLFGEEYVTINAEAIHYQYNYGIYSTNLKKTDLLEGWYGYEVKREFENENWCALWFDVQNPDKNIREHAFESTILMQEEELQKACNMLQRLFAKEFTKGMRFPGISEN